jgi:uncharacterized membrane protein YedE/YeeE
VTILLFGVFGLLYGIVLQRSGFCFARAAFELFLLRTRNAVNSVLAGLIAGTIGFALVATIRARLGLPVTDHLLLLPFGPGTFVGAAMFGLGMSLAGMCVVGSLFRLGEGYVAGALALLGMVIAAALDPFRAFLPAGWRTPITGIGLAGQLGLPAAALLTLAALAALWLLAGRASGAASVSQPRRRWTDLASVPVVGGVLLAILNTVQMALHAPWTVAYPLGVVASAASGSAGLPAGGMEGFSLHHPAVPLIALDLGVVVGAAASALVARDLRLRWPRQRRQVGLSLAGGMLMGWGVQLAQGCNIGGLFSALPSLSVSAWLFLPGLVFGAWLGSLLVRRTG